MAGEDPAFDPAAGISKIEYFAAAALTGLLANPKFGQQVLEMLTDGTDTLPDFLATRIFLVADACVQEAMDEWSVP